MCSPMLITRSSGCSSRSQRWIWAASPSTVNSAWVAIRCGSLTEPKLSAISPSSRFHG